MTFHVGMKKNQFLYSMTAAITANGRVSLEDIFVISMLRLLQLFLLHWIFLIETHIRYDVIILMATVYTTEIFEYV